jgi:ectoine hydroxylase-related dioxygenase (phytanoyl-CoA dioxygenase family)
MDDSFTAIAANRVLSTAAVQELQDIGFVVVPGPIMPEELGQLAEAYDSAVATALASAGSEDAKVSKSTTRVHDFVNRGSAFDELYLFQPLLEACCHIIGQPFKLSSMLARTLHPHMPAQELHVDFKSDGNGWPMVGFIFMLDGFRSDNGATRFVPGSHKTLASPEDVMKDTTADCEGQVLGCGSAGSMIIYNGSTWHGHTANRTAEPRRSIQGAFIRREAQAHLNQRARIRPETLARIGDLATYLLDVEPIPGEQAR